MNNTGQNTCKQRFKGVENFLRRIAFNLGNSPSQTEVKIISCIPIDVTDLQQKILDLERLLRKTNKPPAIVHTALCETGTAGAKVNEDPDFTNQDLIPDTRKILSYENINIPEQNDVQPSPCSSANSILEEPNKVKKAFFRKSIKKKLPKTKHNKVKSHMVYYAQETDNSPFRIQRVEEKKSKMKKAKTSKDPNNSFLADVIRRQYEPLMFKLSGASGFSSPVCRDIEHSYVTADACASEICSCCRLGFVNIDKNKAESEYFGYTPNFRDQIQSKNMYYDSSLYDLVPVKEAPIKSKKNIDTSKKYQNKNEGYFPYCDYGYKPYVHPMCVNYHTIVPSKPIPHSLPRRSPSRKKRMPMYRRLDVRTVDEVTQEDTSNSCRIECGNVYAKPVAKKPDLPKKIEISKYAVTYNNAKTSTLQDTECQTTTETQNVETNSIPSQDGKTEETLNQIKTILQSVLTEVKTNTKSKPESEQKAKKDAVVQKGTSFGNMPGSSRLLNSFTYSPYNVSPYPPTYSHPMNPAQPWPGIPYPAKYMHNFPVFIQTAGRQACTSYFKKPSHVSKIATSRGTSSYATSTQATSGTNTDENNQNHETETLIKEIYKSMALNIAPKKDTSVSNFTSTPKRTSRTSTKSSFCYGTDKSVSARQTTNNSLPQSLYRRAGPMTSGLTPFTSNMFSNKMTSNTVSVQSHVVSSTDTDRRLRNERLGHYLATTQEMPSEESAARKIMQAERRPHTTRTDTESSSEESDDDENQSPVMKTEMQKKERNSLFTKMINSVKLFKNRRRKSQKSKIESEEDYSDSDDYQTVYSQQMEQARRAPVMQTRRIPHSKVSYSRHVRGRNPEKLRKANMEQEYRRQWNEQFMFQPPYAPRGRGRDSPGYYEQSYEARPTMVEQSVPVRSFTAQDWPFVLPQRAPPNPRPPVAGHAAAAKGLAWFKKRCKCGEHFRSLIVDN